MHETGPDGTFPPNARADVFVPAPANRVLAIIKLPPAVHTPIKIGRVGVGVNVGVWVVVGVLVGVAV